MILVEMYGKYKIESAIESNEWERYLIGIVKTQEVAEQLIERIKEWIKNPKDNKILKDFTEELNLEKINKQDVYFLSNDVKTLL